MHASNRQQRSRLRLKNVLQVAEQRCHGNWNSSKQ